MVLSYELGFCLSRNTFKQQVGALYINSIQFILYFNVLTQQLQEPITESAQM
jgi:hypothetical protein